MTQANIDIGTGPSTGDGDPIRTAFNKVNENFTELYATINQQGITYVNVAGISSSTGTGATFNITKYANAYAAVINQQGTGYGTGNVITVWGNVIGGAYTTNDLSITVANIGNAAIGNIRAIGSSGSPSVPILSVAGRTGAVVLTVNDIVGLNTLYSTQANVTTANLAMKGYVDSKITANIALLVNAAPTTLDTIRELADAIGDDPNFAVNVALSVSSANTKMRGYVDGQILAANAGVTAANLGMKGYVDSVVGGSSNYSNANVASYLTTNNYATKSTVANLTNGSYTVSLDNIGNVTLPGGATIGRTPSNTAIFTASTGGVLEIKSSANNNKLQVDDTMVSVMAADSHWHFDDNGKLTLPSGANITSYGVGVTTVFDDNGVIITQQIGVNAFSVTSATGVRAIAGGQIWTFNGNGSLSFPDGQIQTTAFNNTAPIITALIANAATQSDLIIGINANVSAANLGMKGYVDSVASQSIYGNGNVKSYLTSGFDGNIIPSANVAYSLGSSTAQWKDLFVSNNTIFIGGVPLSIDAGGNLLINGNVVQGATGNITLPAGGIITAPNDEFFKLQAKDTNSLLRNEIKLDPNTGTYMSVWSGELDTYFSTSEWDTASWIDDGGGVAVITNAETLYDFWNTGVGSVINNIEVSINDGPRIPVQYNSGNSITSNVSLDLANGQPSGVPPTNPTTITSLTFYYQTQNKIEIDYDGGEILLDGQALSINLKTTDNLDLRSGQNLNLRGLGAYPVRIYTDNTTHMWEFDSTGSLTLPREGKINGIGLGTASDRPGYMTWAGNSSGDGSGFNTMRLVPDELLESADQYIIIDPTAGMPGHIHIRAGGVQDNSGADLFLGGENSHVKISAGANPPVTVLANNNIWTFGTDGNLTLPAGGQILDSTGNLYAAGESSYGNAEVATYLPTYTGNIQAGNVKVTSAYRFASGAVTITNGDSHVELSPDTGANALAGVKVGGNGYILGPNASRCITLNYSSVGGAVGLQSNVTIGTGGSGNLVVLGRVTAQSVSSDTINGNVDIVIGNVANVSATKTRIVSDTAYSYIQTGNGTVGSTGNIVFSPYLSPTQRVVIDTSSGSITASGKIGYTNGGFVQQITANNDGVSLNTVTGNIQLMNLNLGVNAAHTVALTNNKFEETDMLLVTHQSGGVSSIAVGAYYAAPNTAIIWLRNISGADTGNFTPMLKFAIIKAPGA